MGLCHPFQKIKRPPLEVEKSLRQKSRPDPVCHPDPACLMSVGSGWLFFLNQKKLLKGVGAEHQMLK